LHAADAPAAARPHSNPPHPERARLAGVAALPAQAHLGPLVVLLLGGLRRTALDDGLGVGAGLQQAGDDLRFVDPQRLGVGLQADVDAVRDVTEGVPPALLAGVLGHLHQRLDDALVLHLVDPAQVADVTLADAAPAVLQAADLRLRHQQPFRHLLRRHALELTEPAQLLAQPASPDGGIDIGRHGTCTSGCVPRTCSYLPLCVSAAQQTATKV